MVNEITEQHTMQYSNKQSEQCIYATPGVKMRKQNTYMLMH